MSLTLGIIGGGVMGEAILRCILQRGTARASDVTVAEVVPDRRRALESAYGVKTTASSKELAASCSTILLAVKPQSFPETAEELKAAVGSGHCIVSIMAGIPISAIVNSVGQDSVVRVMPNTPAQIGEGVSVWTATPSVSREHKEAARAVLQAMGKEIYVDDEKYLDMATALSGSGPAYVFLFLEALIDAGVHIGMSREMAGLLSTQTILGSIRFAEQSGQHPAVLRNMVTSPGGTTAEGLLGLEEGGLRTAVAKAVIAAYAKAQSLGSPKGI
ncbi:MAG: pyrroline-5-carboxylate reductase [Dehalococcoidia bacterium]|nr:pyrroline-5-carboxylate reductase [Dehalococcoidia bacterium]